MYLVKEDSNWADEFGLQGFKLVKADNEEEVIEQVVRNCTDKDEKFPIELYFGTNEFQEYDTKEDLINDLSIQEITEDDVKVLLKLFPNCYSTAFGTTAII